MHVSVCKKGRKPRGSPQKAGGAEQREESGKTASLYTIPAGKASLGTKPGTSPQNFVSKKIPLAAKHLGMHWVHGES